MKYIVTEQDGDVERIIREEDRICVLVIPVIKGTMTYPTASEICKVINNAAKGK